MSDLLAKALVNWDPVYRGRTRRGALLGLAATAGRGWLMTAGAYVLKRGVNRAAIDQVVGVAPAGAASIAEAAWCAPAPGTYLYRVVPVGAGGVEAVVPTGGDQIVQVRVGDDGLAEEPAPAAPRELRAWPVAGGRIRLAWMPGQGARRPAAGLYAIYAGLGAPDWTAPIATVAAGGSRQHGWISEEYEHGLEVSFGVRARSAAGVEEANTETVTVAADAEGPAAAAVRSALIGSDE